MIFRTNDCRTNDIVPCRASYHTNQNTYFELFKRFFTHFYKFLQFFYEFLHISMNFFKVFEFLQTFTTFSKVLYFPRFLVTKFYKFLPNSPNFFTFLQISMIILTHFFFLAETNVKTCLHAVLFHHRLNSLQIFEVFAFVVF